MRTRELGFGVALAILTGGCSQIEVKRHPTGMVEGLPYSLPNRVILVTTDYELTECSVAGKNVIVKIEKSLTATSSIEPGERFYVPYSSIRNPFKAVDLTVESYGNASLKGFTAKITDKTSETIAAVVGTAARIATWSIAAPTPAGAGAAPLLKREDACNKDAIVALDGIARITAKSPKTEADLKEIEALRKQLQKKIVTRWVLAKAVFAGSAVGSLAVYPSALMASGEWVTKFGVDTVLGLQAVANGDKEQIEHLKSEVKLSLDRQVIADPELRSSFPGVVVREPVLGLLQLCADKCPVASGDITGMVGTTRIVIPQLGDYVVLPLRNGPFQDGTVDIGLSEEGGLAKIGIVTNAAANTGFSSANATLDSIKATREARDAAREAERTKAEGAADEATNKVTAKNQAVAACFAAQNAVKGVGGISSGACQ